MKRLAIISIISVFLILGSSVIHAQDYFPLWQIPNLYGQFGQYGQYWQPWSAQAFMVGYPGAFNLFSNDLSSPQRFSSGSSSEFRFNLQPVNSSLNNGQYYIASNQTAYAFNTTPTWNPLYKRTTFGFDPDIPSGLPMLSQISYNSAMGAYYAPQLSHWESGPKYFRPGGVFFTYDDSGRNWALHFFQSSPALYSNGTMITSQGTSQVETITIEDDGETFTFEPGVMFRVVLPMYDEVSNEDFPLVAGWEGELAHWSPASIDFYGLEPITMGLEEDEDGNLIQENTYRALKETQNSTKELVYYYHGPSGRDDTFSVTIKVRGSGSYAPSY